MDFDLPAVDQLLVEEAVSHKQALVSFALTPPFERPLRECRRQGERHDLDDFSQMVEAVETLLFTHRYDDGSSVLDRYLDRHRKLDEQARELIASWNDSVEGVFEVSAQKGDWLLLTNLFDEMSYTAFVSAGAESIPHVNAGSFLVTRVLPVEGVWLLSGHQVLFAPGDRAAIAQLVAERSVKQPELVLRNPARRRTAEQTAQAMHRSFLACFGTDLLVVRGDELAETSRRFYEFHTRRVSTDEEAIQRALNAVDRGDYAEQFDDLDTVGIEHRPDSGIWFYAEYALVAETFANPDLVATRRHRDAVQGYLDDSSIPPWVLERLAESFPDNADQVMRSVLRRRAFRWAADGESLLRQRKPDFFDRQPVSPGVAPAPTIALEHYASQT